MGIKNWLSDLFFPLYCCACGREGDLICSACESSMRFSPGALIPAPNNIERLLIAGNYEQRALKELIKSLKFKFIKEIGPILGRFLIAHLGAYKIIIPDLRSKNLIVMPIPLSARRLRERGFNQAAEMAKYLSTKMGYNYSEQLSRTISRPPQSSLSEKDRRKNLNGVFIWLGKNLQGSNVLLVDDVVTTGSTLSEAAASLKKAGAGKIYALVAAKG